MQNDEKLNQKNVNKQLFKLFMLVEKTLGIPNIVQAQFYRNSISSCPTRTCRYMIEVVVLRAEVES